MLTEADVAAIRERVATDPHDWIAAVEDRAALLRDRDELAARVRELEAALLEARAAGYHEALSAVEDAAPGLAPVDEDRLDHFWDILEKLRSRYPRPEELPEVTG